MPTEYDRLVPGTTITAANLLSGLTALAAQSSDLDEDNIKDRSVSRDQMAVTRSATQSSFTGVVTLWSDQYASVTDQTYTTAADQQLNQGGGAPVELNLIAGRRTLRTGDVLDVDLNFTMEDLTLDGGLAATRDQDLVWVWFKILWTDSGGAGTLSTFRQDFAWNTMGTSSTFGGEAVATSCDQERTRNQATYRLIHDGTGSVFSAAGGDVEISEIQAWIDIEGATHTIEITDLIMVGRITRP